jgi:hypothetical protein
LGAPVSGAFEAVICRSSTPEAANAACTSRPKYASERHNRRTYKIYLEGETDSQGNPRFRTTLEAERIPDRTFDQVAAGSVVNVAVANRAYLGSATHPSVDVAVSTSNDGR